MKIKLYEHPLAIVEPKVYEAKSVAEWLFQQYGESPSVALQIYKGEPCVANDVSSDVKELAYGKEEYYTVLQSPGLPPPVVAFLIQVAIAVAISVVMSVLFPPPDMPGNVNRTQSSPNNSLANRENQVRLNQRVEDIYGTVKAIPSLMMPTYVKYENHKQMEYGYYCVGRGYYDIADLKDGDTPLTFTPSSRASIYKPFTSPNSGTPQQVINGAITDSIYSVKRSAEIDGITLKALNQVQLPDSAGYTYNVDPAGDRILQERNQDGSLVSVPNFNVVVSPGDRIEIVSSSPQVKSFGSLVLTFTGNQITAGNTDTTAQNALKSAQVGGAIVLTSATLGVDWSFTGTVVAVDKTIPSVTVDSILTGGGASNYNMTLTSPTSSVVGVYEVQSVEDGEIVLVDSIFTSDITCNSNIKVSVFNSETSSYEAATQYTEWVILPDKSATEIWCNILARSGMYIDTGSGKSQAITNFDFEVQMLDDNLVPYGGIDIVHSSLGGATTDERAITLEYTKPFTAAARVRIRRTTDFPYWIKGTVIDEIKWKDLYAVTPVTKLDFGNKTTIHTVSEATPRATNIQNRQLNCIASRKLPTYNGNVFSGAFDSTGLHVSGTISATSKIVNILAAVVADPRIGNNISQLDLSQCWGVQQELDSWSLEAGQFNYTFDSDSASFEETVTLIANAGFCLAYRQNGKIRLAFDKLQPYSTALFTHRNKKPNSEFITRTFATDAEYEGVEFTYRDPDKDTMETILLPLGITVTKYKKFEIPGIRSFPQAWYRANREYKRLLGQRLSIETDCTTDARLLLPNTRIDVVDNTRFKAYDGEVIKQEGMVLTLSRDVHFGEGVHSIILMLRDGSLQSIACVPGARANQVGLLSAPYEAIVTEGGRDGIRTIFSFASDSARSSQAWLVQEVGLSDNQYIKVKAINYSPDYYYYDTQPVPLRDSVINS
jgi:hypothetical protein